MAKKEEYWNPTLSEFNDIIDGALASMQDDFDKTVEETWAEIEAREASMVDED